MEVDHTIKVYQLEDGAWPDAEGWLIGKQFYHDFKTLWNLVITLVLRSEFALGWRGGLKLCFEKSVSEAGGKARASPAELTEHNLPNIFDVWS